MNRLLLTTALVLFLLPHTAFAFCGFYVGGGGKDLFNDATMVVMMREGTRTVLSMQNDYAGPPSDFALVIPVPQVLKKANVRTLPAAVFDKIDKLAAPRLVEYWEQDPCAVPTSKFSQLEKMTMPTDAGTVWKKKTRKKRVRIEAKFDVAEYNIVVLSADDSTSLETWLHDNKYNIPKGSRKYFRPYLEAGQYFFVAKVDVTKVKFAGGHARLSPLRFHYNSGDFSLPIRLGLINARGKQDLIVHILAKNQRYEVGNYPNVTIPTNLELKEKTKAVFGSFYASMFDAVTEANPKAVVTEYAWQATKCDPCPSGTFGGGALNATDIATLGADVLAADLGNTKSVPRKKTKKRRIARQPTWVLTRLHARYDATGVGQDLVFRKAEGIVGGRVSDPQGASKSSFNQFQGRYIIRHPWRGPVACDNPRRNVWGGPNGGSVKPSVAQNTAYAKDRKLKIASYLQGKLPNVIRKTKSKK